MRRLKPFVLLVFLATFALAGSTAVRPECNKSMAGKLWPPTALKDKETFRQLSQSGELQVCARTTWHYRWQSLTVNARDLHKKGEAGPTSTLARKDDRTPSHP